MTALRVQDEQGREWIHPELIAQLTGRSASAVRRSFDKFCGGTPVLMERGTIEVGITGRDGRTRRVRQTMYRKLIDGDLAWLEAAGRWSPE